MYKLNKKIKKYIDSIYKYLIKECKNFEKHNWDWHYFPNFKRIESTFDGLQISNNDKGTASVYYNEKYIGSIVFHNKTNKLVIYSNQVVRINKRSIHKQKNTNLKDFLYYISQQNTKQLYKLEQCVFILNC